MTDDEYLTACDAFGRVPSSQEKPITLEYACQMTLCQWYAGQALAGLCANPSLVGLSIGEKVQRSINTALAMIQAEAKDASGI